MVVRADDLILFIVVWLLYSYAEVFSTPHHLNSVHFSSVAGKSDRLRQSLSLREIKIVMRVRQLSALVLMFTYTALS